MHRRESILQAVTTQLTGLTVTGANVSRGRPYAVPSLPALTVEQGADTVREDWELASTGRTLGVIVTAHIGGTGVLETTLNAIAADVFAALTADVTQGLAYVFDTRLVSDDEPDIDGGDTGQPVARIRMNFDIDYEHSTASAES